MRFWAMALRVNNDGSRPTMRVYLDGASIHATKEACLAEAEGILHADEWQPVQVEVRILTKLTPPPPGEEIDTPWSFPNLTLRIGGSGSTRFAKRRMTRCPGRRSSRGSRGSFGRRSSR